jgi:hypothetical protein
MCLVMNVEGILGAEDLLARLTLERLSIMLLNIVGKQLVFTEEALLTNITKGSILFPVPFHVGFQIDNPLGDVWTFVTFELALSKVCTHMSVFLRYRPEHFQTHLTRIDL